MVCVDLILPALSLLGGREVIDGAIKVAEGMDTGNVVALLADGGWKYLSTSLWTKDYEELAKEARGKIWW